MSPDAVALWTEQSSDPELIAGVRAGDTAAFGVLYERHVEAARRVAHMYTNSASDVDDVVSEAFSRVLRALQRGDGPDLAFRAYLFTIVRRTGMDIINKGIRTKPREDMAEYEATLGYEPSSDEPTLDGFEHGLVADAFRSLPERWQAVLWYTEVEKKAPKDIAPILGLSANGVAALAYRAREALRQAYLQQHLGSTTEVDCVAANEQLGAYVRGGLSTREYGRINEHVIVCERCSALVRELEDVNRGMRAVIAPLVLGTVGLGALDGGLPLGGTFAAFAGATPGADAGSGSGGAAAGSGFSAAVASAVPAVAVVGVLGAAVAGAAWMGLFSPSNPTEPVAQEPTVQTPSASPEATPADPVTGNEDAPDVTDEGTGDEPGFADPAPGATTPRGTDVVVVPVNQGDDPSETGTTDPDPGTTDPDVTTTPPQAKLAVQAAPLGFLAVQLTTPTVPLRVTNSGTESSQAVQANVSLPPGLAFAGPDAGGAGMTRTAPLAAYMGFVLSGSLSVGDWTCTFSEDRREAYCTTTGIGPGQTATALLKAVVTLESGQALASDAVTRYTITWGADSTSYEVPTGVAAVQENFTSTFSDTGHLAAAHFGAPLLGCTPGTSVSGTTCEDAMAFAGASGNSRHNNNAWAMTPLNEAGGEHNSATTSVSIPEGATVVYAMVEWSANRASADGSFTHDASLARLRVAGGDYAPLTADAVTFQADGSNRTQYVARADITALVAAAGSGDYSLADIALSSAYTQTGSPNYVAGFAITVVYSLDSLPESQVTVFAGAESVASGTSPIFTLAAGGPAAVTVGMVAWDGDRGTTGDRATLNPAGGSVENLLPLRWDGSQVVGLGSGTNALASTALGSRYANTLGTDAVTFSPVTVGKGLSTVTFTTSSDVYLVTTFSVTVALQP